MKLGDQSSAGWRKITVDDVKAQCKGSVVSGPFGSNIGKRFFVDVGVPLIRGNNLTLEDKKFIDDGFVFITEEKAYELRNCEALPGDLIFTAAGTLGQVGIIPEFPKYPRYIISNKQLRLRCDPSIALALYLYYWFSSRQMRQYIINQNTGASVPLITLGHLRSFPIHLPPLPTQRKIAAILSAYDDLIENNLRRIKILEEMAQLIYQEWFVNFRFPGHEKVRMVDSDLGRIPEGWEIKKTKEVVKRLKAGNTYTMNDVEEIGKVIVVDQSRNEYLGFHNNEADHKASPDKPIIIFGDHTCKMQLMVEPFSVGPNVVPFVAVNNLSIYYVFFLVKDLVSTQEYKRHWTELSNKQVAVSLPGITKQFANLVIPMFEDIETLRKKNINLSCTRDLLVPKLISGELDVSELDIDVGEEPE